MKRLLAYPVVVLALLAGCAHAEPSAPRAFSAPSPSPVSASPAPTCPPSGVRLELGAVDAAMGLRALGVNLLNCGTEPYRVNGYPAAKALDEKQWALAIRVLEGVTEIAGALPHWAGPPTPVVLDPGERAIAIVVWRNTYDDTTAPPVDAPYLRMAPAAGRPTQVLAPEGGLDLGSTGRLGVSPWRLSPSARGVPSAAPPAATPPSVAPSGSELPLP